MTADGAPNPPPAVPGGPGPVEPPSTTTSPPRDFGPDAPPNVYFTDPDVIAVDPPFGSLIQGNTPIQRLWHGPVQGKGILWAEGPAWCAQGRYLLWSDIPNDRQLRWLEDDGHVSVFRQPSNNSNGNAFDFQGRQISCEHLTRRVVRYELDGSVTVLADPGRASPSTRPTTSCAHPDGSVWFTDPPFGGQLYEGQPDAAGGPEQPGRAPQPAPGPAPGAGPRPAGAADPGLPLGPQRPAGRGRHRGAGAQPQRAVLLARPPPAVRRQHRPAATSAVFAVTDDNRLTDMRTFTDCVVDGIKCGPDGVRADVHGNVWVSSNAGRNVGYSGVTVWNPDGRLLGRIRIPEVVGNLTFGGPKRNRLFMAGSQSLYAVYVGTQGAAPG